MTNSQSTTETYLTHVLTIVFQMDVLAVNDVHSNAGDYCYCVCVDVHLLSLLFHIIMNERNEMLASCQKFRTG